MALDVTPALVFEAAYQNIVQLKKCHVEKEIKVLYLQIFHDSNKNYLDALLLELIHKKEILKDLIKIIKNEV